MLGGQPQVWPAPTGGFTILTYNGRGAARLLLDSWGIGHDAEVLVPSYNCGTELDAILSTGAAAVPYRIDRSACVDPSDLVARITPRTRAVYVTHFFGWPQQLSHIVGVCRERGLKLIEDCALSLCSADGERMLGRIGDGAVFSFTKSLGVPDGGAATWTTNPPASSPHMKAPSPFLTARRCLSLIRRDVRRVRGTTTRTRMNAGSIAAAEDSGEQSVCVRPPMPPHYSFKRFDAVTRASRCTRGGIRHIDPQAIVSRRRENYSVLASQIGSIPGIRPLFLSLPPGVCPLVLPLLVDDRARWTRALNTAGIDAIAWWSGYHGGVDWDRFPDACYLKDHVLALPVHQWLGAGDMQAIAAGVTSIAALLAGRAVAAKHGVLC